LFELLTDQRISDNANVKSLWEGIQTLFQFRNVLAHGREISATMLSAYWIEEEWKELFSGGYKKAENYLLKNKLVDKRFVECDSTALYFNDNVADHFWELSKKIVHQISESLAEDVKEAFDSEVFISNDNGNA